MAKLDREIAKREVWVIIGRTKQIALKEVEQQRKIPRCKTRCNRKNRHQTGDLDHITWRNGVKAGGKILEVSSVGVGPLSECNVVVQKTVSS